jgi:hypothetical protein
MQLKHSWQHQIKFQVITEHEAPLNALSHLTKTETQPAMATALEDDPMHQLAIHTANIRILVYQTNYPTLAPRQQSTLECGLAYLPHENTIINKKYKLA